MNSVRVGALVASLMIFNPVEARAEDGSHESTRAAGWAVLGIGGALGLGSIATGAITTGSLDDDVVLVGQATVVGGIVTVVVSAVVGLPLVLTSDENVETDSSNATLRDALSGRVRF